MIWQCSRFGEVEWAHPMDAADTTARLAAAAVFARQFKYPEWPPGPSSSQE